jgi:hypothetical protein
MRLPPTACLCCPNKLLNKNDDIKDGKKWKKMARNKMEKKLQTAHIKASPCVSMHAAAAILSALPSVWE